MIFKIYHSYRHLTNGQPGDEDRLSISRYFYHTSTVRYYSIPRCTGSFSYCIITYYKPIDEDFFRNFEDNVLYNFRFRMSPTLYVIYLDLGGMISFTDVRSVL